MSLNIKPINTNYNKVELKKYNTDKLKNNYNENIYDEVDYNEDNTNAKETERIGNIFLYYLKKRKEIKEKYQKKLNKLEKGTVEYNNLFLEYKIALAGGYGKRMATVAAARYLSEEFELNGQKLPYFWGGKRLEVGVDENWGNLRTITGSGTNEQPLNSSFPYGLDCSGFVSWILINGGYNIDIYYSDGIVSYCKQHGGKDYKITDENLKSKNIKVGDIVYRDIGNNDHIAFITGFDIKNEKIKIAEERCAKDGMVVTEMSFNEFLKLCENPENSFNGIIAMEEFYKNKENLLQRN